ncbi:MAG: cell division protein FtsW [Clostridia bacterium]|nr:cell division protein FtsW [Clostridia bacterium]
MVKEDLEPKTSEEGEITPAEEAVKPNKVKKVRKQGNTANRIYRIIGEVDRPLLIVIIALVCIGSVMVFSASYAVGEQRYGDSYFFARKQIIFVLAGIVIMAIVARIDYRYIKRFAYLGYFIALVFNFAVRWFGETKNGATRWFNFLGLEFQPSELLKFFLVLSMATYISDHLADIRSLRKGILPLLLLAAPAALSTLLQNHASATIIILLLMLMMIWISGTKWIYLAAAGGTLATVGAFFLTIGRGITEKLVPQVFTRLEIWEHPENYMTAQSGGKGWQPMQSLYAISSGGFWGLGLGQSNQKHGYLPEPQNDYIFAILCEELGFFGVLCVKTLFAVFAYRGYHIAQNAPNRFCSLVAMGITLQVVLQVILNLAVVTNSFPSTGISLPFFSYGGTSLVLLMVEMGVLLSISRYSFTEQV